MKKLILLATLLISVPAYSQEIPQNWEEANRGLSTLQQTLLGNEIVIDSTQAEGGQFVMQIESAPHAPGNPVIRVFQVSDGLITPIGTVPLSIHLITSEIADPKVSWGDIGRNPIRGKTGSMGILHIEYQTKRSLFTVRYIPKRWRLTLRIAKSIDTSIKTWFFKLYGGSLEASSISPGADGTVAVIHNVKHGSTQQVPVSNGIFGGFHYATQTPAPHFLIDDESATFEIRERTLSVPTHEQFSAMQFSLRAASKSHTQFLDNSQRVREKKTQLDALAMGLASHFSDPTFRAESTLTSGDAEESLASLINITVLQSLGEDTLDPTQWSTESDHLARILLNSDAYITETSLFPQVRQALVNSLRRQ